jgi:hypothetical protein
MSNIRIDKFYVYQPYGIKENNGYLWAVGLPHDRFIKCETTIKGLTKDEAQKIANVLNGHMFLVQTSKPSIAQQRLSEIKTSDKL